MQRRLVAVSLFLCCVAFALTAVLPAMAAPAATTVTIGASANPVVIGSPETITFTVKSSGSSPLTGNIAVANGNQSVIDSLTNGAYVIARAKEAGPAHVETLQARYLGDTNNAPSPVVTLTLTILEPGTTSPTKIFMTSSANPTYIGQVTTYTASVLGSSLAPATGTVSFSFGDGSPASVQPLASNGISTATHAFTSLGNFAVTATYSGDASNPGVTAPTLGQVVMGAGASPALTFVPITPCRVADTRTAPGPFGGPSLASGVTRSFSIPQGACSVPATAAAYSLNVTAVPHGRLDVLIAWPTGEPQPLVSLLNSGDGRTKANAAIVPAGTAGAISLFVSGLAPADVVLDINGYFVPATPAGLAFYTLAPCRIADTRKAAGPLGGPILAAGQTRAFPVQSSHCNIPASAKAYSLNVTGISPGGGLLSLWPTGQSQPSSSTVNLKPNLATANAAIVPAGTGGSISIYAPTATDVVLDVNGYFAPPGAGGLYLHAVTPCRALDTRNNAFPPFPGLFTDSIEASTCAPSVAAAAYVLNATVVPIQPVDVLTLWPSGQSQPESSVLNATDGATTSNMAIVGTNNGAIDAYSPNQTNLVLDLSGYFAP